MCRLLAYLGPTVQLERLITEPEHSLVVQSYQPRELEVALLNADGFGLGWYRPQGQEPPFVYRNIQPIWNDANLSDLCRYAESDCVLAYIRSATPGLAVDLHNCQPFSDRYLSFIHNGFIENFRQTLYRPLRERLCDRAYQSIHGLTDSEHIFALILHELEVNPDVSLERALENVLLLLIELAQPHRVRIAANIILSDGHQLVVSRFDTAGAAPSLYWLRHDSRLPGSVLFASEPLFHASWEACPQATIMSIQRHGDLQFHAIPSSGLSTAIAS